MRYSTETCLTPAEVLSRAVSVFGSAGMGMTMSHRDLLTVRFGDSTGHVTFETSRLPDGDTEVIVETMYLDDEAVNFISTLPRRSLWYSLTQWLKEKLP